MYDAFTRIAEQTKKDPLEIFETAMKNVQPTVEVKSKRVGGANYQIPIQVRAERRIALGFRWVIAAAEAKKGRPMAEKLAAELTAASNNEGDAVKKKMDVTRMAEANRAFAHFARYTAKTGGLHAASLAKLFTRHKAALESSLRSSHAHPIPFSPFIGGLHLLMTSNIEYGS